MEDSDKVQDDGAKLLTKCPINQISTVLNSYMFTQFICIITVHVYADISD